MKSVYNTISTPRTYNRKINLGLMPVFYENTNKATVSSGRREQEEYTRIEYIAQCLLRGYIRRSRNCVRLCYFIAKQAAKPGGGSIVFPELAQALNTSRSNAYGAFYIAANREPRLIVEAVPRKGVKVSWDWGNK